jgi:two-component SAPR family response regulator
LEDAGAHVLGPVSSAEDALTLLEQTKPDCALVDINLGAGPSFESAWALRSRNIPMIFLTGYDASTIPSEFANAPRLEKPIEARGLVAAVAALCGG